MFPVLGILALITLAGCSREVAGNDKGNSSSVPKGDYFIRNEVFPNGGSKEDSDRLNSLQNFFQKKNLAIDTLIGTAKKIPWVNEKSRLVSWKNIDPQERMDSLSLVSILMCIQKDNNGFYPANKDFIDTVFNKMGEGRLRLQKLSKAPPGAINSITAMVGKEQSAAYDMKNNILMLGLPLDPSSLKDSANYLHELFHFYQDATKDKPDYLEMEVSAYAKQGEWMVRSLDQGAFKGLFQGMEDFIEKSYPKTEPSAERPAEWGLRYAKAGLDQEDKLKSEAREKLEQVIHLLYYFQEYFIKNGPRLLNQAEQTANTQVLAALAQVEHEEKGLPGVPKLSPALIDHLIEKTENPTEKEKQKAQQGMEMQVFVAQQLRDSAMQSWEKSVATLKQTEEMELEDSVRDELMKKFDQVLFASAYLMELKKHRDRIARGDLKAVHGEEVAFFDPKYLELYRSLSKYRPLKFKRVLMDGVE